MTRIFIADARRRWPDEQKRAIIEESKTNPVARVAKKHGVAASLLFRWRKAEGIVGRRGAPRRLPGTGFIPVSTAMPANGEGGIEIVLASGARLIVGERSDLSLLRRVVAALC